MNCDYCHQLPEDFSSCIMVFPCISEVLDSYPTWDFRRTMHFSSFLELVQHVITTGKDLGLFAPLIWTLWYQRNQLQTSRNDI